MKYFFTSIVLLALSIPTFAYNIHAGDLLHLEVYGEPELMLDITVDTSGFIDYPFVGKIKVAGNEIEHVKAEIINKLKDGYFIDPQVTVFIKKYQPFFIQGEVESPGSYPYEVGLTIRKAIALAGGLTERASKKKIYLVRVNDTQQHEVKVTMDQEIASGDVVRIKESFF
jgi:polysaccharide export outer membrane protein